MNDFIGKKVMGRVPEPDERPTSCRTARTRHRPDRSSFSTIRTASESGDLAVICSFGAGYSAGNVIVRKR